MGRNIRDIIIVFLCVVLFSVICISMFFKVEKNEFVKARVRINVVSALSSVQIENAKIYSPQSGQEFSPNEELVIDVEPIYPYKIFPYILVVEAEGYLKSVVYAYAEASEDKCNTLTVNMFEDDGSLGISAVPLVISPEYTITQQIANSMNFDVD